jgi:NAD(P)-dependent dehydrogenase (short-subunit alcohol dehydrogenase family)
LTSSSPHAIPAASAPYNPTCPSGIRRLFTSMNSTPEKPATHAAFLASLPQRPDMTICVFGYLGDQQLAESDWTECERILQTNYVGAVSILNLIASEYAAKGSGLIAGISSVAGERGRQSNYFYGSAKAGFTAYLSGLRNRLFHKGVHVLTVQPGFVYTKMTENMPLPGLLYWSPPPRSSQASSTSAILKKKNVDLCQMVLALDHAAHQKHPRISVQKIKAVTRKIAFFDFDGTITTKDTLLEFIRHSKGLNPLLPRLYPQQPLADRL